MLAYTYLQKGKFGLREKPKPKITDARDAIVRVTLGSFCTSDLHINITQGWLFRMVITELDVIKLQCRMGSV